MPSATPDDLTGIPLFDSLEPEDRATIAPWFEVQEVSAGVNLTGEGATGYEFFVLRDGTATVTVDGEEIRTIGSGDFFGELAILGDGRRTATVTTDSASQVLVLFGTEFRRLQQEFPGTAERIESALREIVATA
jgi:voltage-gated potassium channel